VKRAGDVLSALFDEGFLEKAKSYSAFFSCWKDLMEKNGIPAAADHSRVKTIEKGIVWAEVDHPGWKQVLQTKESKLLADFQYRFPDMGISGLSISLCKPGALGSPQEAALEKPATAPEKRPPAGDTAPDGGPAGGLAVPQGAGYDAIKDEAFKEALMRLERSVNEREERKEKREK
jgi:hypothetical protein